jgi:hypothetical protein
VKINFPCIITSRLCAGVKIADAEISIEYAKRPGSEGRTRYLWHIDLPDKSFHDDDIQSGCQGGDLRQGLESLLSFLDACGESVLYGERHTVPGENAALFPPAVAQWASEHADAIGSVRIEIEESPDCIQE